MRASAALVLLSLLGLSLVPPTLAQSPQASVDMTLPTLPAPVPPGTAQRFNITVGYRWSAGTAAEPTTIRLEVVDEPAWLTSVFEPPSFTVDPKSGGRVLGGIENRQVNLTITLAPDAPAFEEGIASYRAVAEANPPYPTAQEDVPFEITAGFSGVLNVTLPEGREVGASGGLLTRVPVRLENQGNGPLLVSINVARFPAEARVEPPDEVRLGTGPDERVRTVHLDVRVPWKVSESGPVEIEVIPTHATRGTPAPTQEVAFELDGKSAVPIPGFEAPLVVLGLAVLAVLRRRG